MYSANSIADIGMMKIEKRATKEDFHETLLYPISERIKEDEIPAIQEEIKNEWKHSLPEDDLKKAINTIPDIIRVSKILGEIADKYRKKYKKHPTTYDAFIDFINHPTPGRLVKALADDPQEALESIYKLHVKLYHTLPGYHL